MLLIDFVTARQPARMAPVWVTRIGKQLRLAPVVISQFVSKDSSGDTDDFVTAGEFLKMRDLLTNETELQGVPARSDGIGTPVSI
jgi:hypothetical protein